ncbi:hypothetical protein DCAR_0311003 [Daucus carota subsp. sativus]|uniref:Uncharacterized protein n=1 Tax=Daucus carota subsp. sativus TaxID=79200 RepID=A0AAF0WLG4_DAUCS|nr:PREDICTED: uncharacterized protein LOC108214207 [Daucus carota subsp. sativus]XP_017241556.1 PREDICTED: uncharacterized protein LOC108214207 [Daucus carota subsp. sativus]XP_017241557.1 PREDICTED: uncharacterized protein LOC108214207 [Daucus carota subsp. sativus]WOG91752.1 hypothetical protein DCAR_0311003 [Daucus carota subsp. sativus]
MQIVETFEDWSIFQAVNHAEEKLTYETTGGKRGSFTVSTHLKEQVLESFHDTEFWYAEQGSMSGNLTRSGSFRRIIPPSQHTNKSCGCQLFLYLPTAFLMSERSIYDTKAIALIRSLKQRWQLTKYEVGLYSSVSYKFFAEHEGWIKSFST